MCEMILACYDDDDDYNFVITPYKPIDSLIIGDEHLNTIPATESDEFIKSSVENLVLNPSESKGKNGCDVPACFTTFSNILFDTDYDFYYSDDQSLSDEDFPKEIYSNLLFDEEIISMKIDPPHFNAESDLIESLLNHDSSITSSSKIDSLFDEFTSELKINLSFTSDDPMPPGIEEDDYDFERDILIYEELLDNHSLSLPENESFHFDTPSSSRPPAKPPDVFVLHSLELHILSFILGIHLLHLIGSQLMLKSSYKADAGVIISIPPLDEGVTDVVVEIKGTEGEIKAITTRSGVAYERPSIPTPKKVVEQESEETTDKEHVRETKICLIRKFQSLKDIIHYTMMSEDSSAAGTDNHPPMLEESDYESWKIRKVIVARNKRNVELEQETELLKTTIRNKEATIASLTSETKAVLSEKKTLEDKYLEEIVCLKNANQVATSLLQKFQMPTQTIPMLSKRPMIASNDIHKTGLGLSNPWFGRKAQLSQPTLYDGHRLLQPSHAPVTVSDSHETLLEIEVSRMKMSQKPRHVTLIDYTKLNALYDQTSCDREHNRVLELEAKISKLHNMLKESEKRCVFIQKDHIDLQVKFHNFKDYANSNATPLNTIFEINKLKDQLQERDETIRNLESQFNISQMLKIGSPVGSLDKNALETEITQLKDNITSLRIQNDGYKIEIANHTRRYLELLKASTHSRNTSNEKIAALNPEIAKMKPSGSGTKVSGPKTPENPKVLAPGMYAISSKYITPPRRGDWAPPTPRKKHVVQIVLWYLDSGCSRHMTGDHSKLINYVEKFVFIVRFGNDQFATIVGYGDYKMQVV
nr:retrovirus-related Pol polyprotein from transposon TNT 1-94 [Tanacetum cinerariifolium]